ncbi:thiopeptide-type bacteriocin biosynthesis protein [Kitasatospora sp. NPDC101801]|uniref:thiopeptide-type bacteriocin biosynthesis protein n=1 Tax=Kitasatospora sp. NPDC101801 TaxID=3364103 RepID=UPI0038047C6A
MTSTDTIRPEVPQAPAAPPWLQQHLLIADPTDMLAEMFAALRLGPGMTALEEAGVIVSWHFLRKGERWRLRYQVPSDRHADAATAAVTTLLRAGLATSALTGWRPVIYEPESRAFGGPAAMEVAHRHFHTDSRHTLTYLLSVHDGERADQRKELALLLATALMRGAGLDWYEQGDVWATIADHRTPATAPTPTLRNSARQLISVDSGPGSRLMKGQLHYAATWFEGHLAAGADLAALALEGRLTRGLRAVTAHLLLFHFNRLGLSANEQGLLAAAAAESILNGEDR